MTEVKTQGIVLTTHVYAENDLIVSFLTQEYGKISAFAASAKKSKKRFAGGVDLFSYLDLELKPPKSKSSHLWRLQKTRLLNPFYPLRQNLAALANASYLSECINKLLPPEENQDSLFDWWKSTLGEMCKENTLSSLDYFKMDFALLSKLGYQPHFDNCLHCLDSADSGRVYFSFEKGGVLCKKCFVASQGMWVPSEILKNFSDIHSQNVNMLGQIMHRFMAYTLGFVPKSQPFRWESMEL